MRATLYVVQSFKLDWNRLKLDLERNLKTEAEAVAAAKRLAITGVGSMATQRYLFPRRDSSASSPTTSRLWTT